MESTSQSSKVTVEYHDPSSVFPLVSRDIAARLPLRNLNWQSPPRPLRQIKSLHVDFVPDKHTEHTLRPPISRTNSEAPQNSLDIVRSGVKNAPKERRHQIPGFRTSPYLKIFLLRCDDKEAYKENDRKSIRAWIKDNAQPEGKQNHDACEWLILHIVVPDTVAASEPRWRESSKDPDDLRERKGGNKLIGKSTRTVFDRLRADFNESGKSGLDRVAQIRVTRADAPEDLLPTPAVAQTYEETAQERENAWSDLISKFKTLILGPFDRRVRQYEADIAEQESRRSLPGWNFCTFFIHKEGLAMALESIGLVEDALAIYDELSLGLENVLRDIAAGLTQGTATTFAPYTDDIRNRICGSPDVRTNGTNDETTNEERSAPTLFSKDYREKIVRSDISVFDFSCYIFLRQKALLLRLANAKSVRQALGASREGGEDLVLTSEVCWRASTFIHNAARILRQDLMHRLDDNEDSELQVESLVCSWMWAIAGQILGDTKVPALADLTKLGLQDPSQLPNGNGKRPISSTGVGANTHPQRTSSLPDSKGAADMVRPSSMHKSSPSSAGSDKINGLPGQVELATYRAELIMMRRKALEQLARRRGWYAGWAFAEHVKHSKRDDVDLDDSASSADSKVDRTKDLPLQILCPTLTGTMASEAAFEAVYENLTVSAIRHYFTATQSKSAETLLGDMAMLKCQQDDFMSAATYFQHILPSYRHESWDLMELEILSTYSFCLKRLQQTKEYVHAGLALLAKISAKKKEQPIPCRKTGFSTTVQSDDHLETSGMFVEIVDSSEKLKDDVTQPLKLFFDDVHLDRVLTHHPTTDGFSLTLHILHVLGDEIHFDEAKLRLVSVDDPSQEVWLTNDVEITVRPGSNQFELKSTTVTYGPFLIDTIILRAKRILFVEEVRVQPDPTPLGITAVEPTTTIRDASKTPAFVFLYPSANAFSVEVSRSRHIHIDKPRHLEIALNAGRNDISKLTVRLKPKSAGLRLHLADAAPEGIEFNNEGADGDPRQLSLLSLHPNSDAFVIIPYTVEQATSEINVRLEVTYETANGAFTFLRSTKLRHELPLDVDVNDIFHLSALFSNFTVRTTTQTPFVVLDAELMDSPVYAVAAPQPLPLPLTVFQSQPMNLAFKITRRQSADVGVLKRDAALALAVRYLPMDHLLVECLRRAFTDDLQQSPFSGLLRLLLPLLLERFRQFTKTADLEITAVLGEANVPDFNIVGWHELVATLPETVQQPLEDWLLRWHTEHSLLSLAGADDSASQRITITVDVPNVDMVFSTSLCLPDVKQDNSSGPLKLILGQPVKADLCVKHTNAWSSKTIFPNVPTFRIQGEEESQSAFVLDVGNEADTWLVGGQRRRHFRPDDGRREDVLSVVLVPLKLGLQPLPLVEIQQELLDSERGERPTDATSVSCETYYESAGQMVQVIRDVRNVVVHVAESAAANPATASRPATAT